MKFFNFHRRAKATRRPQSARAHRTRLFVELLEDRTLLSVNPVVAENQLPGTPQSVWDISGAGDSTIQGYATDISVNVGSTVSFKINDTAAAPYHLDIYRMGYYQGNGARLEATIPSTQTLRQIQPSPITDATTGLIDAGNWAVSASWSVPSTAVSGIYFAKVTRDDTGVASHIVFIVRNDASHSDVLFQTSDATWEAYNTWGGNSLYGPNGDLSARAHKVSYNRPFNDRGTAGGLGTTNWVFYAEYPMVRWLEANGYDVSYFTDMDSDRYGSEILNHKVFLSVGHDEYWSGGQRANVLAARDAGVNLAFLSGNEMFWKTRWENSIDGTNTPYRTLVCYKETLDNAVTDPKDPPVWTGTWADPRFSPPADGGLPQNALTGTEFMVNRGANDTGSSITVPYADSQFRLWRNTTVAQLQPGQVATLGQYVLGYEWDEDVDNGFRPAGLIDLSSTTVSATQVLQDYGSTYNPATATHQLTLYRAPSGALVFGAGTVQWSWGLDGNHDGIPTTPDLSMEQATVNLLADMYAQPQTLQQSLVNAYPSTDVTAPTATITTPLAGSSFVAGSSVTIAGTATDPDGPVAGVEVSTDGGSTWHPAVGTSSWSYVWVPTRTGQAVIEARASDDSANLGKPSAGVATSVHLNPTSTSGLVAAYNFNEGSGSTVNDVSGNGNNGTISNATWTTGLFGSGLSFNGINSWVTVPNSSSLGLKTAMTLEAWVTIPVRPQPSNWYSIITKEASNGAAYALYASNDSTYYPLAIAQDKTSQQLTYMPGTAALPLNTWAHLAATYDGSVLDLYVNGTLVSSEALAITLPVTSDPLRLGGSLVFGDFFQGTMDDVRVYNRALNPGEILADMNTPVGSGAVETGAPTVSVTSPAGGSTVSGTVTITASATDDVRVAGVQFFLDGQAMGPEVPSAPYSFSWDTTKVAGGSHTLYAVARDAAGNQTTSASLSVTVNNGTDTTIPTVSLLNVASGQTLYGKTLLWAIAQDNDGIANVQFQVDGTNIGTALTAAPYRLLWDSTAVSNATHTITVVATDTAGNKGTSSISVFVNNAPPGVTARSPVPGATLVATNTTVTATFTKSVLSNTISFVLKDPNNNVVPAMVSYDNTSTTVTLTPNLALQTVTTYTATLSGAQDLSGNTMTAVSWSFSTSALLTGASIWGSGASPVIPSVSDTSSTEVGVKFRSDVAGSIVGLRFYRGPLNTGTHVGHLWTVTGTLLGTATFSGETASGWQQVNFPAAIAINPNTTYVASYLAPNGGYSATGGYFTSSGTDSPPLHALANGTSGGDGVYVYGSGGGFPTNSFNATNYWVDVVFNAVPSTTPPAVSSQSPAPGATNVAPGILTTGGEGSTIVVGISVNATFSEAVQANSISFVLKDSSNNIVATQLTYNSSTQTASIVPNAPLTPNSTYSATVSGVIDSFGNVMTAPVTWTFTTGSTTTPSVNSQTPADGTIHVAVSTTVSWTFSEAVQSSTIAFNLKDQFNNTVTGALSYNSSTLVATFTPNSPLSPNTKYTATVTAATDLFGNAMSGPASWSFTTNLTTFSIWSTSAVPAVSTANDTLAIEVGVKFRSDVAGTIIGLRFYKGAGNTGTHIAHLWTSTGTSLATATFAGETPSGWQQVIFATPATISANTTYVASYYAPSGGYSYTSAGFASGVDNVPLHALANGVDGSNGVYQYISGGGFPTNSYNSTNYWVDVLFQAFPDTASPTVTATSPTANATGVGVQTTVSATFNEPVQPPTISFVLKDSSNNNVPGTVTYSSGTQSATFTPNSPLAGLATYTATVSGAQDVSGNLMAAPVSWSFTTGAASYSVWSGQATPAVLTANDTSSIEVGAKFRSSQSGTITGIMFYKGAGNVGTHVGHLWSSTGTQLAAATFTGETASGWQTINFATPVTILPNTTYIASYYAPSGGYSYTSAYFATSGASNGPLTALASGVDGNNGLYLYSSGGGFPTNSYNSTNYWVDVVFTTSYHGAWTQTTVADFNTGTNSGTVVVSVGDGAVQEALAAVLLDDFTGSSLGSNWTTTSWTSQGGGVTKVTTANSILSVQAAAVLSTQTYVNTPVEGMVAFAAEPYQHFGMATGFNSLAGNYWAIFSTAGTTNTLYARVNSSGNTQDVSLGALPTGFHDYKIVPISTGFQFYVDSVLQTTISITFPTGTAVSVAFSDFLGAAGGALQADWVKIYQYAASATFTSVVFDAGKSVTWGVATWDASVPAGTTITIETSSSTDNNTWSAWTAVSNGASVASPPGRYFKYEIIFSTTNPFATAILDDITFNWS